MRNTIFNTEVNNPSIGKFSTIIRTLIFYRFVKYIFNIVIPREKGIKHLLFRLNKENPPKP